MNGLTQDEAEILEVYQKLNDENKKALIERIKTLLEKQRDQQKGETA